MNGWKEELYLSDIVESNALSLEQFTHVSLPALQTMPSGSWVVDSSRSRLDVDLLNSLNQS